MVVLTYNIKGNMEPYEVNIDKSQIVREKEE